MMFFVGPKLQPLVWRVMLGPSPSRIEGTCSKGFNYTYFDAPDKEGYVSEIDTTSARAATNEITQPWSVKPAINPCQLLV